MRTMRIRPVGGARVRDPETGALLTEPRDVACSTYWMRRLRDGDVAIVLPEPDPPAEPTPEE